MVHSVESMMIHGLVNLNLSLNSEIDRGGRSTLHSGRFTPEIDTVLIV
jgi:hypothetical protein